MSFLNCGLLVSGFTFNVLNVEDFLLYLLLEVL